MTVPDAPTDADVIVSRKNPGSTVDDANHNCGVGDQAAFDSPNWAASCTFVPVRRAPQRPPRFACPGAPRALCPS